MKYREKSKKRRLLAAAFCFTLVSILLAGCGGVKRITKETEDITLGIDVAKYQGTIDWEFVSRSGIDFAMVRIGYSAMTDGEITPDSNAKYNMQEAQKFGVKLGVYFFSTAVSEEEAIAEADWVADYISQYSITYPVVYDCEGFSDPESRQFGLTKEVRTDIALAFLEQIEKRGYPGMFYASKSELQGDTEWETSRIEENYKIWVAQYPEEPYPTTAASSYTGTHHMWQYTKDGTVPGISQPVDLNIAYFGFDGVEPPMSDETPEEVGPDVEALMDFQEVNEQVTAKEATNLRDIPSQDTDSQVLYTLQNGEVATRIAVSSSGWSKLVYNDITYYAVSSYLTTDLNYAPATAATEPDEDGIQTEFTDANEQVTAKDIVNLRTIPSVTSEDSKVVAQLKNGDVATCVGVSSNGWSKLIYNGTTCYAVSSYLTPADGSADAANTGDDGIQTQFEDVNEQVTAKVEVNLRTLPSVEDPNSVVVIKIKNGDIVTRTGINRDVGWSRIDYNGQTLYCVSSYIQLAN